MPKVAYLKRLIVFALMTLLWVVACSPQSTTSSSQTSSSMASSGQPLISGDNPWPGYSGQYVALAKDFFSKEGVKVQETFFQSASDEITAFLAGKLDLGWFTSGDAIQMAAKDPSIKMIYLVDYSNGSDGILGRDIKGPQDLKGKTIGRENILFENVLLNAYLAKGGLTPKDVTLNDMTAADAATAFAAKRIDAAVSYEPWLTKAAKQSGGEVIFSTKDTNLIADVIATRDKVIQTRKADLQAYIRAIDKATKLVNSGDAEAVKISAQKMGVSAADAKDQITGVKIFDLEGNKTIAFNKDNKNSVIGNLELTAKAAYDQKITPQPLKVESLYDDSIVKGL